MRYGLVLLALCFILASWNVNDNEHWKEKVSTVLLENFHEEEEQSFIIVFTEQADVSASKSLIDKYEKASLVSQILMNHANKTQQQVRKYLEQNDIPFRPFYIINAIQSKGDVNVVKTLAQFEEVAEIQADPKVYMQLPEEEGAKDEVGFREGLEWGLERIGVQQVWDWGYRGQGVIVGGQDTGYEWEHVAIKDKYRGWDGTDADHNYNWHDAIHEINPMHGDSTDSPSHNPCGVDSPFPCDDNNHGTHTMGTMVGELSDEGKHIGVAPEAKWIACRNMERGYGSPTSYIECFEWFLAPTDLNGENPDPSKAPHVIANSWSCPEIEGCVPENFALMQMAVDNLKASGVVVVVSAGNNGSGCSSVNTPAAIFENSFSIGATSQNDTIAGFSSRGPVLVDGSGRLKPNVSAPGVNVRSCIRNGGFANFSGTSMAGPHVAGMVALLISAKPELAGQVEEIESLIEQTAKPMLSEQDCGEFDGSVVPNAVYGYGRVDVLQAVEEALGVSNVGKPGEYMLLKVYPNPSTDIFSFTTERFNGIEAELRIFNLNGQVVYQSTWEQGRTRQQISLNNQPSGVYIYKFTSPGVQFTGKLVKK